MKFNCVNFKIIYSEIRVVRRVNPLIEIIANFLDNILPV